VKARNLWGKKEKEKEKEEEMERKTKKEKKMLGWAGQVFKEKNKKSDFVDLLSVLLGMGQADLPMCQYGSRNWVFLDFGKFVDLGEQTRSNFKVTN